MFTLQHLVGILVIQSTVSTISFDRNGYIEHFPQIETVETFEETEHSESEKRIKIDPNDCLEKDYSLISYGDLKYLIDKQAEKLEIKEHFINHYYPEAMELSAKYSNELEDFREQFEDRPNHIFHILNDMAKLREELQPVVERIAFQLQDFYDIEDRFSDLKERSNKTLNQLDKLTYMCKFYCDDNSINAIARFGHETTYKHLSVSESAANKYRYCVRLENLNDNIDEKFSQLKAQYDENFYRELQTRDDTYAQKIIELQTNLKEAAVKLFGTTMYDILSLQDEYHHFTTHMKTFNVSTELHVIEENIANINLQLIGLKRDLEKYWQYCKTCSKHRMKRSIVYVFEDLNKIQRKNDDEIDILDELIEAKMEEIMGEMKSDLTDMFKELDQAFNDPDIIDLFLEKLKPIQYEIENNIEMEQQALRELSDSIPEDAIEKILILSQESKQIIEDLKSAKQFIDGEINSNIYV